MYSLIQILTTPYQYRRAGQLEFRFLQSVTMLSITRKLALLAFGIFSSLSANGTELIVGLPSFPGDGNCIPFGCGEGRYQQVISSSVFSEAFTINRLTFYNTQYTPGQTAKNNFYIYLSTTQKNVEALSWDFEENSGADRKLFASTGPSMNAYPQLDIDGQEGFFYNPRQGNLLLDVISVSTGDTDYIPVLLDMAPRNSGYTSRLFSSNWFFSGMDDVGLTIGFNVATPVPEPSVFSLALAGATISLFCLRRQRQHKRI